MADHPASANSHVASSEADLPHCAVCGKAKRSMWCRVIAGRTPAEDRTVFWCQGCPEPPRV